MLRSIAIPLAIILAILALASVITLLLVALAYGLGGLLGRWLPLAPFELTALSLIGLLGAITFIMRAAGAALASVLRYPMGDEDEHQPDILSMGPYDEDDDEDTDTYVPPARSSRRQQRRRK